MAKIEVFFPKLMKYEGGFVNDKDDKGGATNRGITLTTYKAFFGQNKTVEDLKHISDAEVIKILKSSYWDKIQADNIVNQSVAEILVDYLYNSGVGRITKIQELLGVVADGQFGAKSLEALNSHNQEELFNQIKEHRINFFQAIVIKNPAQSKFLKGWLNRINDFKFSK